MSLSSALRTLDQHEAILPADAIYTSCDMGKRFSRQSGFLERVLSMILPMLCLLSAGSTLNAAATPAAAGNAAPAAIPAHRQANQVAVLTIHTGEGMVDNVTLWSLERRMKQAVKDGADAVVLDIDTFGGDLAATLNICNLLKDRNDTPANVVAWIHPKAYSAGTIIALACREIVVSPGSTFGDAAPINLLGIQLNPTEREKILRPLLTEVIDSARRNHYDEKLVQSFIMIGQELWMIENLSTGERIFVDRAEYNTVFGQEPPSTLTSPATMPNASSPVRPYVDTSVPKAATSPSMSQDELKKQVEFEQTLPTVRPMFTSADKGNWRLLMKVTDDSTLLTVKPDQAIYYGLATSIVANDTELQSYFGASKLTRYDQTWSEGLVRFLISWPVRAVLIIIFLVSLFIEMAAPGFGVFGAAAIVALLALIGAPALVNMAQWWDILLVVGGLLLIAVELFVLPGVGIAGVAGVVCLLIGLIGTFVSDDLNSIGAQNELWVGLITTLTSMFIAGVAIWFISRQIHSLPLFNQLILNTELKDETPSTSLLEAMGAAPPAALSAGDLGIAETDLRPSGRAEIKGRLVDVQSTGGYIEKGTPIRVLNVGKYVVEVEETGA
jgi:membrane-bound serine protease (ClpP class)